MSLIHLVIISFVFARLASSLSLPKTNYTKSSIEVSVPRTVDKNVNLLVDLYKMYDSIKTKSHPKKKSSRVKSEMIPLDGLYFNDYFNKKTDSIDKWPTLNDITSHPGVMSEATKTADKKGKENLLESFLKKIFKKTELLVIVKVFLKVIIFKAVIKFIALICLLFFIPTLKLTNNHDSKESDEDSRGMNAYDGVDYGTKEIFHFAISAIEGFSKDPMVWCVAEHDAFCRFRSIFDRIDQIVQMWFPQSTAKLLKVLRIFVPPKSSITEEADLRLPHDDDEADFPIEISGEVEQDEIDIDEDSIEADDD